MAICYLLMGRWVPLAFSPQPNNDALVAHEVFRADALSLSQGNSKECAFNLILSFLTQVFNVDFRAGRGSSASCAVARCLYGAAMGLGYLALSGKILP